MPQLIVHGGAGAIKNEVEHRKGIREVLDHGWGELTKKGALEAVVAAVSCMEDNPVFNCGTGSSLNIEGEVEMDASLMLSDGSFGGVASVKNVQHPILLARKVMEETDHLLLAGSGAEKFARELGFPFYDPRTSQREKLLEEMKKTGNFPYLPRLARGFQKKTPFSKSGVGTVGAVAREDSGLIAVATSTGGIMGKMAGRVGDSCVLGAGTYASNYGGVSCTGHGESILRLLLAYRVVENMCPRRAQDVIPELVSWAKKQGASCGVIGIDWRGNIGFAFNTDAMSYGYVENGNFVLF